ncbi:hypothetical protein ABZP36_025689 [Zizania latifolia]
MPLRVLLRRRRPPIPSAAAASFFTCSGGGSISVPTPPPAPVESRNEPEQEGSLAQRVERAASVCAAIRGWMAAGRAVHRGHIFHAVNRLRRRRLHRTALQVGSIDQAEEIWGNIKSTRKLRFTEQFNSILSVYCRHGLVDKASAVFKEMRANGCQPNAITYHHLALGCLKAGIVKEALKTMEIAKKEVVTKKVRSSTPWLETSHMLLENFAETGDLLSAKRVFSELNESKYCRNSFVFNTLLKAYVKAKVYEPDLLRAMILRGAMPDAETYSLLGLIEQFKT